MVGCFTISLRESDSVIDNAIDNVIDDAIDDAMENKPAGYEPHMGVCPFFEGDFGTIHFSERLSRYMAMVKWRSNNSRGRKRELWQNLHSEIENALCVINREIYVSGYDEDFCLVPVSFLAGSKPKGKRRVNK